MKSPEDSINTEPIPVTEASDSSDRSLGIVFVGTIALGALLFGTTIANKNDQIIKDVLDAERPPSTERNLDVSELASAILDTPVLIDCNSNKIEEAYAESSDDTHTLAYVQKFTFGNVEYVPPYITMRGRLCDDLLTFPRMKMSAFDEVNSTYVIRAKEFTKAAAILLHEKEHIDHIFDEGEATCYAVQKLPEAIESYFENAEIALAYAETATEDLSLELKPEYTSSECTPGGAFDLGISSVYTNDAVTVVPIQ